MNRRRTGANVAAAVVALGIALLSPCADAEIYKCTGKNGRVTFQDSPCIGTTGTTVNPKATMSGVVVMQDRPAAKASRAGSDDASTSSPSTQTTRDAALRALESERRRRTIDYEITDATNAVETLKASMDEELAGLRARKDSLAGVSGSPLEAGVSNELQAATERYQAQIRAAQDRVADLKRSRDEMAEATKGGARDTAPPANKP